jgi:hypothetical protein
MIAKKTKVYECKFFKYEYDEYDKYRWCRNDTIPCRECPCDKKYAMSGCPGYKKGRFLGSWELQDWEKDAAKEFNVTMSKKLKEREDNERALLKLLKEKYES